MRATGRRLLRALLGIGDKSLWPREEQTNGRVSKDCWRRRHHRAYIFALANALDKKNALSFEEYRDALLTMYREMPHEDASADPGLIFDGMLTQLERAIRNRERQT